MTEEPAEPGRGDGPPRRPPRPPANPSRPASRLEVLGWVVLISGLLVLVYFALTRPM